MTYGEKHGEKKQRKSFINDISRVIFSKRRTNAKIGFSNNAWRTNGLRILYYISKFVLALLSSIEKIKLRLVDQKIFSIINDVSGEYEFFRSKNLLKDKATILDKLKNRIPFLIKIHEKITAFQKNVLLTYFLVFSPDTPIKVFIS
jgi:hypothetical protein